MSKMILYKGDKFFSDFEKYFRDKDIIVKALSGNNVEEGSIICLEDSNPEMFSLRPKDFTIVNFHYSLLPAFCEGNSLQKAFTSGVKVSGITIHRVEENNFYGRILAQYPVLIGTSTHFDEYSSEIFEISKKLYPKVAEAVINDTVFDFEDILKGKCAAGCSSCKGCSH